MELCYTPFDQAAQALEPYAENALRALKTSSTTLESMGQWRAKRV